MSLAPADVFQQMVLQFPDLCEQLWRAQDRDDFIQRVQQVGAAHGIMVSAEAVRNRLFTQRREWREQGPITTQPIDLEGWMPIRLALREGQHIVEWCYMGNRRFTEPFFEETVAACLRHPLNIFVRVQTPISFLTSLQNRRQGIAPSGFIFHMSRCGSTLVAQSLAALPQAIMLAEAEPIDAVLRARFRDPMLQDEKRAEWLQAMVSTLGRQRHTEEQHLFIKFDSWSIMDVPLIQRTFPNVPWLFLYRDPVEVMVSHQRMRGSQMVPGLIEPALLGFEPDEITGMPLDEYCARTLATICQAAVRYREMGNARFVSYSQLPEIIWPSLFDFFGVACSAADLELVKRVALFHAKSPSTPFTADAAAKQDAASTHLRQLADRWVRPTYELLNAEPNAAA